MSDDPSTPGYNDVLNELLQRKPGRRPLYWKLVDRIAVPCDRFETWAESRGLEQRRVAETRVGPYWISTVFLGVDHNPFDEGEALLFESMVFRHSDVKRDSFESQYMDRCSTYTEAEAMHEKTVAWAKSQPDSKGVLPRLYSMIVPAKPTGDKGDEDP